MKKICLFLFLLAISAGEAKAKTHFITDWNGDVQQIYTDDSKEKEKSDCTKKCPNYTTSPCSADEYEVGCAAKGCEQYHLCIKG